MRAGEENELDVKEETVTLPARFYPVGIALGLPSSKLDKIRQNYPRDCDEALSQVIIAWLKQSYDTSKHGHPSWKKLVEAVASEAGGQNPALARKIAAAHQGKVISIIYFSVVLTGGLCLQPVGNGNKVMVKVFHDQSNPVLRMVRKSVHLGSGEEWAVANKLPYFVCKFYSCGSCVNYITPYIASMKRLKLKIT